MLLLYTGWTMRACAIKLLERHFSAGCMIDFTTLNSGTFPKKEQHSFHTGKDLNGKFKFDRQQPRKKLPRNLESVSRLYRTEMS